MTRNMTIPGMVAFFGTLQTQMAHHNHQILDRVGRIVTKEAKRVLGTYDYGWAPLAQSTVDRKGHDRPGIETGEMQQSIEYTVGPNSVGIGTNVEKAVWFELGTSRQPPRSFLVGAVQHKTAEIQRAVGGGIAAALGGASVWGPNSLLP
jgi:phage gpG-like protein